MKWNLRHWTTLASQTPQRLRAGAMRRPPSQQFYFPIRLFTHAHWQP